MEWFKKDSECEAFLRLINHEGFILEEIVLETLSKGHRHFEFHSGDVFRGAPHRENKRIEIDLLVKKGNFIFNIETKRSDYDWVFLKNQEAKPDLHLITGPGDTKILTVMNCKMSKINCVSKQVVEVQEDSIDQKLVRNSKSLEKNKPSSGIPQRSTRDEYVHNAVRQALFNIETLIHSQIKDRTWNGVSHRIFIPIIVTNARILAATYNQSDISSKALLTKILNIESVPYAAITHAEILKYGPIFADDIVHIGRPPGGLLNMPDERYKGSHNKTVFVVNQSSVVEFIDYLINETDKAFQHR
jgi:hypothetical protein